MRTQLIVATTVALMFCSARARADEQPAPNWHLYLGVGLFVVGGSTAVYFGEAALADQRQARDHHYYVTDPRLQDLQDQFRVHRTLWIAGCGAAVVGTGFAAHWLIKRGIALNVGGPSTTVVTLTWKRRF